MNIVKKTLTASLLALSIGNAFAAGSPGVEHNTQAFLEALAAGGGKPLEQLSPKRGPCGADRRPGLGES